MSLVFLSSCANPITIITYSRLILYNQDIKIIGLLIQTEVFQA